MEGLTSPPFFDTIDKGWSGQDSNLHAEVATYSAYVMSANFITRPE